MANRAIQKTAENGLEGAIVRALGARSIVLVGMMGAGKSSVGPRLAARLGIPFLDGEARVIARLLDNGPQVLATGGGSVMDPNTRALIREKGVSVWLKADLDVLLT